MTWRPDSTAAHSLPDELAVVGDEFQICCIPWQALPAQDVACSILRSRLRKVTYAEGATILS